MSGNPSSAAAVTAEDLLDQITGLAEQLQLTHLRPAIEACRARLAAAGRVDVAVFGRFKAGKSSLLNHLARCDVLPVGVVPATAVVTRLRHGPAERAEVRFLDGATRPVPLAEIGTWIGEDENPGNAKRVASVDVELPSLAALAPLQFVDTPGLGSMLAHNTAAAREWLPHVGAALVAISSDAPLGEQDAALLEELRRHTPKIILLLTKADLLSAPDQRRVLAFVRDQVRRHWGTGLPVLLYSVRPAGAALKTQFETEVLQPLIRHRDEVAAEILRHKLARLSDQALDCAHVALAAATRRASARQTLSDRLANERRQLQQWREELQVLAHRRSADAFGESLERLEPVRQALQHRAAAALRTELPRWQVRLPRLLGRWREWLRTFLADELGEISRTEAVMFRTPLHATRAQLQRSLQSFNDRLRAHVEAALDITLPAREIALDMQDAPVPPVDVDFAVGAGANLLAHLLPLTLPRAPIERLLLRRTHDEIVKNLSRLAADWHDGVVREIDALTRQAEGQLHDALAGLEQAVAAEPADLPRLQDLVTGLEAQRARVQAPGSC